MKKILFILFICLFSFTLFGCNNSENTKVIYINSDNYNDYLDIDLEVDNTKDKLVYRWVIKPILIYDNYEFEDTVVFTKNNLSIPDSEGILNIKLSKFGFAKSNWIDSFFSPNAVEDNPILYLEKELEINNVDGILYIY